MNRRIVAVCMILAVWTGCSSSQTVPNDEPLDINRMVSSDWLGKSMDYDRRPYIPYVEYWDKHGEPLKLTGKNDLKSLLQVRDGLTSQFHARHLYPMQIMTDQEFVVNRGGICKDWAMMYCHRFLWKYGYNARFFVGTYGEQIESNLHAWAVVYMKREGKDEVFIVDQKRVFRVCVNGTAIGTIYRPWFSFQGKKAWIHCDATSLKHRLRRFHETFTKLAFNVDF